MLEYKRTNTCTQSYFKNPFPLYDEKCQQEELFKNLLSGSESEKQNLLLDGAQEVTQALVFPVEASLSPRG